MEHYKISKLLTYFDLIAQVISTPCTSETILPPSTSMLRISFCSQDGQASIFFDEINPSFWWSSSWSWMREILFICLMYPRIICFSTQMTKPFQSFVLECMNMNRIFWSISYLVTVSPYKVHKYKRFSWYYQKII